MLDRLEYSRRIFEISSNMKFHENPSIWNRVVICRRAESLGGIRTNGRTTDITKLIVVYQNFANAPINNGETGETG